ncbi:hypothetical protein ACHWQZ_G005299 [Mnemiopsis leidyi]
MADIRFTPEKEEMMKATIGELLEMAATTNVKKAIGTYSYAKGYSTNLDKMKQLSSTILEECALFLQLKTRNEFNSKTYKNKQVLADRIIMKIESHFEEQCDECNQKYRIRPGSAEPYLRCFLCMQGCHDCEEVTARFERSSQEAGGALTGSVWLCRGCRLKNDIFASPKNQNVTVTFDKIVSKTGTDDNEDKDDEEDKNEEAPEQKKEEEDKSAESDKPSPRRYRLEEHKRNPLGTKIEVCPLYKKRQCPHGASGQDRIEGKVCQLSHPRKCLKFCRYGKRKGGCMKGNSCKYFHPVLCKYSVKNHRCLNSECTYTHLKGTMRSERNDMDNKRHHNNSTDSRPQRWRKDSTTSVGSRNSDAYRTPLLRERTESGKVKHTQHPNSNAFLEKLMENLRRGFEEQKTEMDLLKQGINNQIGAIWKQMGSINSASLPQLPLQFQHQLTHQMIPAPTAPWNGPPNQCSMY